MKKTVLVIGATGMLGRPVALSLQKAGYKVRVFSRDINKTKDIYDNSFEFAYGDVTNKASLENALEGCYGVHINLSGGPTPESYDEIEHKGAFNTALAAKTMDIKKLTIITGASVSEGNSWFYTTNAKHNAELAVKGSGVNYTIFKPSWFMESLPLFIRRNKATLIGKQTTPLSWLAVADYARIVADSFSSDKAVNKTLFVLGPEKYSMEEALTKFISKVVPDVKIKKVSPGMLRFFGRIGKNEKLKDIADFMHYCEKIGNDMEIGSGDELNRLLGAPSTTLDQWLENYIARKEGTVFA